MYTHAIVLYQRTMHMQSYSVDQSVVDCAALLLVCSKHGTRPAKNVVLTQPLCRGASSDKKVQVESAVCTLRFKG